MLRQWSQDLTPGVEMMQPLIEIETGAAQALVRVSGRLTAGDAQMSLRAEIDPLLERGFERLVLDLAHVSYLDSAGLGELLRARARAAEHGMGLVVRDPSPQVATLLRLTGLDTVLGAQTDPPGAPAQGFDAAPPVAE
jgi:anti-sigma B factor antagonist